MKKLFVILLSTLLFTSCFKEQKTSQPQTSPEVSASSVGMSETRLSRIDSMLTQAIKDNNIPGAVALIARHGKIVYHKAFGMANNSAQEALQLDHIFRIASQSKAITSTAVMMLWEEGKFQLDDPISKYIPEFENAQLLENFNPKDSSYTTKPADNNITIRHLITHTSGIGYGKIDSDPTFKKIYAKAGIVDLFTTEDISIADNIKKLAKLPLHHNPGEKFTYSEGLDVLGYFVEVVSKMPFDEFLRTRIFEPLGMNDTQFYLPESKYDRLVTVQTKEEDKWINYPVTFYDTNYPKTGAKRFFSGGAGLSSTAKDYATFLQMYLNQGELNGVRLLSRTTVETILTDQIKYISPDIKRAHGLAFGLVDTKKHHLGGSGSEGTFEWGGYFNTQYFADPKEEIVGILLKQTQSISGDDTAWKFKVLVNAAIAD
ncbi:serine hydrolase domain-containing protein [Mariniflexile litorale]|uniref:Serine hydrolase domain-containing protein n=1 Tax=Mariniflexile litorale TaxID=3045158 RepID=A0AAU7EE37_9FLAO|nr:serine hydrolase domain-containing protein [Mariniflexile sp. KMM 9835]MDQ8213343.1 serine hydrolase domain-containing protein [Mariniflexile sp. KMM 9835]